MNTYINNLPAIISPTVDEEVLGDQKILRDKSQTLSEKFICVPNAHVEDNDVPVWQVRFDRSKTTAPVNLWLEINGDIILGVEDSQADVINLSKYFDEILGVSRRHLKVSPAETCLLVMDLNSTNGTRRNGEFIQPDTPYNIYDGDVLELGELTLAVKIVKTPINQLVLTKDTRNIVNILTYISTTLTSNLNSNDVFDRILEVTMNMCRADQNALFLWEKNSNELYLRAERQAGDKKTQLMKVPVNLEYPISEVLRTGKPLQNKVTDRHKVQIATGCPEGVVLYAPMPIGQDLTVILSATRMDREFSLDDENMLCTIGKFAATAIQNSQKYEATNIKLQRKLEEFSIYNHISQELSRTNDLTSIYNVLREQIRQHWEIENIGLWIFDEETKNLIPFPKPSFHKTYLLGEELIGSVASHAEPIVATDIKLFSQRTNTFEPTLQLLARSAACVPIIRNDNVLGVLAVFSKRENEFDEEDVDLLQIFSQAAAPAIWNTWLFEQVDHQRTTILAAVNMLPHPIMIFDQNGKMILSNKATDAMLNEVHSSTVGKEDLNNRSIKPLAALMNGLSESKWCTKEIVVGDKVYIATLEYASMVGTAILMQDITDPVTGTFNQRHFNNLAEQAFQQAKRYANPLAALMVGLEDFDRIINEQGYVTGNQILKSLASQLRGFLRTPDILGRYQNDKFIIILPETTSENAKVVAERIIKLSKNSNLTESYKVKTHLKVGVTILDPKNDDSIHTLIEKAYNSYTLARNDKRCHIKVYE